MKIAVCVCTYRRPKGLVNLLEHLNALNWHDELEIFVADNDKNAQEGINVVHQLSNEYKWPISGAVVQQQGISHARNQAVAMALAATPEVDFVAFLDDDEWPSIEWLNNLVRIQQQHDADAVGGPTVSVFPPETKESYKSNPYYGADLCQADGSPCVLNAAGNFLMKASVLRDMPAEIFDPKFALTGGEDLAFFYLLKKQGYNMYWAENATVYESVPQDRMSMKWMKQRVISVANSRVYIMGIYEPGALSKIIRVVKTGGLAVIASVQTVVGLFHRPTAQAAMFTRWKFWGKFTAHLNNKRIRDEGR